MNIFFLQCVYLSIEKAFSEYIPSGKELSKNNQAREMLYAYVDMLFFS